MFNESRDMFCGHHGDYGCGHHGHDDMREHFHHRHDCQHHQGPGMRRFFTREEKIAYLEAYLKQLQAEVKGVEEHLSGLKKPQE